MAEAGYQESNIVWEFNRLGRQVREWVELQLPDFNLPDRDAPNLDWLTLPEWLLKALFWGIVIGLVVWAVVQLFQVLQPYLPDFLQPGRSLPLQTAQPRQPTISASGWLRQAQECQAQGDYAGACRALYMAMVQRLDQSKKLPDQPSRTDGEYRLVIQTFDQPQPYQVLINTHERLSFSDVDISPQMFHRCQQAYREIDAE
jgi:hypothetical protein